MDPTAEERQKARAALGNTNVQDATQLGELIGHLYLKMSEHSNSASAHINTHAEDIQTLSHKLNKFVSEADAQFQDIHRLTTTAANPPATPAAGVPVQGMNPACNSRTRTSPSGPILTRRRMNNGSVGFGCSRTTPKWQSYQAINVS